MRLVVNALILSVLLVPIMGSAISPDDCPGEMALREVGWAKGDQIMADDFAKRLGFWVLRENFGGRGTRVGSRELQFEIYTRTHKKLPNLKKFARRYGADDSLVVFNEYDATEFEEHFEPELIKLLLGYLDVAGPDSPQETVLSDLKSEFEKMCEEGLREEQLHLAFGSTLDSRVMMFGIAHEGQQTVFVAAQGGGGNVSIPRMPRVGTPGGRIGVPRQPSQGSGGRGYRKLPTSN